MVFILVYLFICALRVGVHLHGALGVGVHLHACSGIDLMSLGLSESTFNPLNHPTSIFTVVGVVDAGITNRLHKCCAFNKLLRDSPFTQLA